MKHETEVKGLLKTKVSGLLMFELRSKELIGYFLMDLQVYDAQTRALDARGGRQLASAKNLVGPFETVSSAAKQSATLNLHDRQVCYTTI